MSQPVDKYSLNTQPINEKEAAKRNENFWKEINPTAQMMAVTLPSEEPSNNKKKKNPALRTPFKMKNTKKKTK